MAGLLWALPLFGQLQIGENTDLHLTGDVGFGYGGGTGSIGGSEHNLNVNGDGILSGSYYNPNFFSFDVQPFFNRSQDNSTFQSITNTSGVTASANIFAGSHFPGSFSYNRAYNAGSTYGVPGVGGLDAHGDSQGLAIAWSALLPGLPSLTASYSVGTSTSEVYGTSTETRSTNRVLNLRSNYSLDGFLLTGFYTHQNTEATLPVYLVDQPDEQMDTATQSYGLLASHRLPLRGYFSAGWDRFTYDNTFLNQNSQGTTDNVNALAVINPTRKLNLSLATNYYDNLAGALEQQFIASSGTTEPVNIDTSSRAVLVTGSASYSLLRWLAVVGNVNHQEEFYLGQTHSATQFSGTLNFEFARPLFGMLNFSIGVVDSATEDGNNGTGLVGNVNFTRRIRRWEVGGDFSYAQQVQTLLTIYTTSSYSYGASLRRRFGDRTYWTAAFRGLHSGLEQYTGSGNHGESFNTALAHRGLTFSGNYSQSSGASVLTANGLVTTPAPVVPVISPAGLVLFAGKSYGFSLGAAPRRNMTLSATYAKAFSDTAAPTAVSNNHTALFNMLLRYRLRKLVLTGGYTRFEQSISITGTPVQSSSFFVGFSRWFDFF
ncbi:MAG TPA: hypothetical protein VLV49_17510 [Terriglobales bacterium]|nr:hypothetical protein [Terriglobales bacterium]